MLPQHPTPPANFSVSNLFPNLPPFVKISQEDQAILVKWWNDVQIVLQRQFQQVATEISTNVNGADEATLETELQGLNTTVGGNVTAIDSILVAIGKLEFRVTIDDGKVTGANRVLRTGDTMTGALRFSGGTNPGGILSNLTTLQRIALTAVNGMLVYDTDLSEVFYYNGAWVVIPTTGRGTVTSVGATDDGTLLTISGSPITTAGTLALSLRNAAANSILGNFTASPAAPTYSAAPTFSGVNITALNASNLVSGTAPVARLPVATTAALGVVKPDGTSITISGGVISSTGGSGSAAQIVASVKLIGQTTTIGSSTIYLTPNDGVKHIYRVSACAVTTTGGSGGSLGVSIGSTSSSAANTTSIGTLNLATTGNISTLNPLIIQCYPNTTIDYQTGGTVGTSVYSFNIAVEELIV